MKKSVVLSVLLILVAIVASLCFTGCSSLSSNSYDRSIVSSNTEGSTFERTEWIERKIRYAGVTVKFGIQYRKHDGDEGIQEIRFYLLDPLKYGYCGFPRNKAPVLLYSALDSNGDHVTDAVKERYGDWLSRYSDYEENSALFNKTDIWFKDFSRTL